MATVKQVLEMVAKSPSTITQVSERLDSRHSTVWILLERRRLIGHVRRKKVQGSFVYSITEAGTRWIVWKKKHG